MLHSLYPSQRTQFDALANAWLSIGAKMVSIWENNNLLAQWPADSKPQSSDLIAPIKFGGRTVGEVHVAGFEDKTMQPQLSVETALMSHVAKLEFELESARKVQEILLPQEVPDVPGISVFGKCLPMSQVGGDYYDFIPQPDHSCIFSVGDVCGKGMSAALLMAMLRKVVRIGTKLRSTPMPTSLLDYVSKDMYGEFTQMGMFATAFISHYEPKIRKLTYANAGHSPVIYRPVGGSAHLLKADGAPLGVLPENTWTDTALRMEPGDLLVIATDGFTDTQDQTGHMFGYERLLRLVDSLAHRSTPEIVNGLFAATNNFREGGHQDDDQTVMVIKGEA